MLKLNVKEPKKSFPSPDTEFISIARFTNPESSLYQCLGIGLIEILIRSSETHANINSCISSCKTLILEDPRHISNQLAQNYDLGHHLTSFRSFFSRFLNIVDVQESFRILNSHTEEANTSDSTSCDLGMRVILASLLPKNSALHEKIMKHESVNDQVLLTNFAIRFNLQINVLTSRGTTEYKKHLPGTYPLMSLWYDDDRGYALLYTHENMRIESNRTCENVNSMTYPLIPEKMNHLESEFKSGSGLENMCPQGAKIAIVKCVPNSRNVTMPYRASKPSHINNIPKPYQGHDSDSIDNAYTDRLEIMSDSLKAGDRKKQSLTEPNQEFVRRANFRENVVDPGAFLASYSPENEIIGNDTCLIVCTACKFDKEMEKFTVIQCNESHACQICSDCRVKNTYRCIGCNRSYSDDDQNAIKILRLSLDSNRIKTSYNYK